MTPQSFNSQTELNNYINSLIAASIQTSTNQANSLSNSTLSALINAPGGVNPNQPNPIVGIIAALALAISNSVSAANTAINSTVSTISGGINQASLQAMLNSNSMADKLGSNLSKQISESKAITEKYIATDAENLRTFIRTSASNIDKNAQLAAKTSDNLINTLKDSVNKSTNQNSKDFDELTKQIKDSLKRDRKHNREWYEDIVNPVIEPFLAALETVYNYLNDRIENIDNTFEKLEGGKYRNLETLQEDLFGSRNTDNLATLVWQLVTFIPTLKNIMELTNAKMYARLGELAHAESEDYLFTPDVAFRLFHTGNYTLTEYIDELRKQGFSQDKALAFNFVSLLRASVADYQELLRRGTIDDKQFDELLFQLGFRNEDSDWLKSLAFYQPTPPDIIRFAVRDVYNEEAAALGNIFEGADNEAYLADAKKSGLKEEDARKYWGAHWQLPSPTMGYEMLFRSLIDETKLRSLLKSADYAPAWIDNLIAIAYRNPTRIDTKNMFFEGVIDENEVHRLLLNYGYEPKYANYIKDFYVKLKQKRNQAANKLKDISTSTLLNAYKLGIINKQDTLTRLMNLGYSQQDAVIFIAVADSDVTVDTTDDYTKEIRVRFKRIAEESYRDRTISKNEAIEYFKKAGMGTNEINAFIVLIDAEYNLDRKREIINLTRKAYLDYELTDISLKTVMTENGFSQQEYEKHLKEIKPLRSFRHKDLSMAQVKKAYLMGVIDDKGLNQQLLSMGYSDRDIEILKAIDFTISED